MKDFRVLLFRRSSSIRKSCFSNKRALDFMLSLLQLCRFSFWVFFWDILQFLWYFFSSWLQCYREIFQIPYLFLHGTKNILSQLEWVRDSDTLPVTWCEVKVLWGSDGSGNKFQVLLKLPMRYFTVAHSMLLVNENSWLPFYELKFNTFSLDLYLGILFKKSEKRISKCHFWDFFCLIFKINCIIEILSQCRSQYSFPKLSIMVILYKLHIVYSFKNVYCVICTKY